jgi:hypothetical protein
MGSRVGLEGLKIMQEVMRQSIEKYIIKRKLIDECD